MGPSLPMSPERELLLRAVCHGDLDQAGRSWAELVERLGGVSATCQWLHQGGEQRLVPLLGERSAALDLPGPVVQVCHEAAAVAWGLNERVLHAVGPLIDTWHAAGIRTVAMKGLALIGDVYPHHRLRPFGDADLLIEPARVDDALDVLGSLGWSVRPPSRWELIGDGAAASYYREGASVDVHQRPVRNYPYRPNGRYDVFDAAVGLPGDHPLSGTALLRPTRPHHAVLLAAHLARPVNAHAAHPVADLHRLLSEGPEWSADDVDALVVATRAEVLSMRVAEVLRALQRLLDTPLPVDPQRLDAPTERARRAERRAIVAEQRLASRAPGRRGAWRRLRDQVTISSTGQPAAIKVRVATATTIRWIAVRVRR